ncbi:RNA polymerase sigma-70 factor [Pedobacter gandavensis]|uniref:RNA polymerase sigma-70 factor n=1 Tax=Pedobacter gandavensis TaxID=2679963 RepID=UPI00292E713F|nr:RNA polymerase sigma-70 factor [Pedobacter gandavensis]
MVDYSKYTDEELVDLVKYDDEVAFAEIFDRYHGPLYIHAFKRLQEREECRDLIQELLTTLWLKRKELLISTTLSGYLFMSVRNRIFNLLTKKKLNEAYVTAIQCLEVENSFSTDHLVRLKQLTLIIDQEITALPARTREIFELSRKGFLSHKEIATQLNISEQTVKTTVNNALKVLRIRLGSMFFLVL